MDVITSVANNKVKFIRSLKDKKVRRAERKFIVEGANIVKDIPSNITYDLIVTETHSDTVGALMHTPNSVLTVSEKVMEALSDTVTPAGIIAIAPIPSFEFDTDADTVVLDSISDPGNVGTIVRICAACGIRQLIAYGDTADCYSPKAVRSSMGGIFHTRVFELKGDISSVLKEHRVLALDMRGENIFAKEFRLKRDKPIALAVGSEAHGISQSLRNAADRMLSIPMSDNMESLNAGVSLGVALYRILNL